MGSRGAGDVRTTPSPDSAVPKDEPMLDGYTSPSSSLASSPDAAAEEQVSTTQEVPPPQKRKGGRKPVCRQLARLLSVD